MGAYPRMAELSAFNFIDIEVSNDGPRADIRFEERDGRRHVLSMPSINLHWLHEATCRAIVEAISRATGLNLRDRDQRKAPDRAQSRWHFFGDRYACGHASRQSRLHVSR